MKASYALVGDRYRFVGDHDRDLGYIDAALGIVRRYDAPDVTMTGKSAPKRSKSNGKLGKLEALYLEALRPLFPGVVRCFELHGSYIRAACKRQRADTIDVLESMLQLAIDGSAPGNVFVTVGDHCIVSTREERSRMVLPAAAHRVTMKALRALRGSDSVRASAPLPTSEREESAIVSDRCGAAPMTGKSAPGRNLASRVSALPADARSRIRAAMMPHREASGRTIRRQLLPMLRREEQALTAAS